MPFKLKLHTWPYFWVQELFCKLLANGRIFIYFSFEIGLFKDFHFKSEKSPPTPILCIEIKEFYWFWKFVYIAYFVAALKIFTKFFSKIVLGDHCLYTLYFEETMHFFTSEINIDNNNSSKIGAFLTIFKDFCNG
jgi:hypothetical protein